MTSDLSVSTSCSENLLICSRWFLLSESLIINLIFKVKTNNCLWFWFILQHFIRKCLQVWTVACGLGVSSDGGERRVFFSSSWSNSLFAFFPMFFCQVLVIKAARVLWDFYENTSRAWTLLFLKKKKRNLIGCTCQEQFEGNVCGCVC